VVDSTPTAREPLLVRRCSGGQTDANQAALDKTLRLPEREGATRQKFIDNQISA
jgi:hypothetical protein